MRSIIQDKVMECSALCATEDEHRESISSRLGCSQEMDNGDDGNGGNGGNGGT